MLHPDLVADLIEHCGRFYRVAFVGKIRGRHNFTLQLKQGIAGLIPDCKPRRCLSRRILGVYFTLGISMRLFIVFYVAIIAIGGMSVAIAKDQGTGIPPPPIALALPASTTVAINAPSSTERTISPDAMMGLIGTLVGAVIGALVSIIAVYLTSKQQQRHESAARAERNRAALSLVRLEIDHNISVLTEYLEIINLDNPIRIAANQSGNEWTASHPAPNWSTLAWENALTDLLGVVPQERILEVFSLYSHLRAFSLATELAISYHHKGLDYAVVATAFFVQEQLAEKLQKAGNPLREYAQPVIQPGLAPKPAPAG